MGFFSFFSKEKKETLDKGLSKTKESVFGKIAMMPGDQVQIEMDSQDIEKLYEPLVSMANIY